MLNFLQRLEKRSKQSFSKQKLRNKYWIANIDAKLLNHWCR